jgi:hypothetical protein
VSKDFRRRKGAHRCEKKYDGGMTHTFAPTACAPNTARSSTPSLADKRRAKPSARTWQTSIVCSRCRPGYSEAQADERLRGEADLTEVLQQIQVKIDEVEARELRTRELAKTGGLEDLCRYCSASHAVEQLSGAERRPGCLTNLGPGLHVAPAAEGRDKPIEVSVARDQREAVFAAGRSQQGVVR